MHLFDRHHPNAAVADKVSEMGVAAGLDPSTIATWIDLALKIGSAVLPLFEQLIALLKKKPPAPTPLPPAA